VACWRRFRRRARGRNVDHRRNAAKPLIRFAGDGRRSPWRKYFVVLFKTSNPRVRRTQLKIATKWVSARSCFTSIAPHRKAACPSGVES
jgi:hypothetical protein